MVTQAEFGRAKQLRADAEFVYHWLLGPGMYSDNTGDENARTTAEYALRHNRWTKDQVSGFILTCRGIRLPGKWPPFAKGFEQPNYNWPENVKTVLRELRPTVDERPEADPEVAKRYISSVVRGLSSRQWPSRFPKHRKRVTEEEIAHVDGYRTMDEIGDDEVPF